MNNRTTTSPARTLTITALVVAAAGIVIQIGAGIDFPTIPPGLIILLTAAAIVAFAPWRWTPLVGAAVGLSLVIGLFAADQAERLNDSSPLGGTVGLWIQVVGVSAALIAGIVTTVQNYRRGASDRPF
jgi:hypothetical protein